MREILFRAKRIDNGEWVEGNYVKAELIHEDGYEHYIIETMRRGKTYEIDPKTLCQYTELKDKNGEKIFIGDIVKCTKGCPHEIIWLKEYGGTYIGGMPAVYLSGLRDGYAWTGEEEKVGNIFDNPELLKGE